MIHHFGVRAGHISLNRMVELLCTNPAKLFGLYPRKGTLAVGSDADVVVFDPEKKRDDLGGDAPLAFGLQPLRGHRGAGLTRGRAAPRQRGRRGRRSCVAEPGSGQFIKRAKFGEELKPADALAR